MIAALALACVVDTSSVTSFRPATPLEKVYYKTSVCYRQKWEDAESLLAAEKKVSDALRAVPTAAPPPESSNALPVLVTIGIAAGAAVLGFLFGHAHLP